MPRVALTAAGVTNAHQVKGCLDPAILAVAAMKQNTVDAAIDKAIPNLDVSLQVDLSLLVKDRDNRNDKFWFTHSYYFLSSQPLLDEQTEQTDTNKADNRNKRAA